MSDTMTNNQIPRRPFGRAVGNTNIPNDVPIIGLGCSSYANNFVEKETDVDTELSVDQDTASRLSQEHPKVQEWISTIKHAVSKGINLLDTAPWYGHGSSEVVIGLALKDLDRSKLVINTKVGRYDSDPLKQFDFSYSMTIRSVRRSLDRMGCGFIDVLQLHDPEFAPSIDLLLEETVPAMIECKKRGWVKALGMTGYPLELHYDILRRVGKGIFDQTLTYGHFNLHNQNLCTIELGDDSNQSFMEYCKFSSVALMAAAPLSMGLLTHNSPPFWHPASNALKIACRKAADTAKMNNVDLPMLAILFALAHDGISCTLLGIGCKRDLDCAMIAVERYQAIHTNHGNVDAVPITCNSVKDSGVALRLQIQSKLNPILTESEKITLATILDETSGPFSELWKEHTQGWDGFHEADLFWSKVSGGRPEAESKMRSNQRSTNAP